MLALPAELYGIGSLQPVNVGTECFILNRYVCIPLVQVFDDVAIELTMAVLQYFQNKPAEEHLFRTMKALSKFVTVSSVTDCGYFSTCGYSPMFQHVRMTGLARHPATGANDRSASVHVQGHERPHRRADRSDLEEGALMSRCRVNKLDTSIINTHTLTNTHLNAHQHRTHPTH